MSFHAEPILNFLGVGSREGSGGNPAPDMREGGEMDTIPTFTSPERVTASGAKIRIALGGDADVSPFLLVVQADLGIGFQNSNPRAHAYDLLLWLSETLVGQAEAERQRDELADALKATLAHHFGEGWYQRLQEHEAQGHKLAGPAWKVAAVSALRKGGRLP